MVLGGGKLARFSLEEFTLITGLICSERPKLSLEMRTKLKTRIHGEYFNGATPIKVDDIQNAFRSLCAKENSGKKKKVEKGKKRRGKRIKT